MRRLLFGLILTTALPAAVSQSAQLSLNPSSGPPTQQFTATFDFFTPLSSGCRGYTVSFDWDSIPLGSAPAGGRSGACSASVSKRPPAGDSSPGQHVVRAVTTPSGYAASATFTIIAAGPSPSPSPGPKVTPSPSPSPSPSPTPSPQPASGATPSPSPPTANLACSVANVPTQPGTLQIEGINGTIAVLSAGPAQMLPPLLGSQRLIAMEVTKAEDAVSPTLQDALTAGTVYPCAFLSLGPAAGYQYARYALAKLSIIGLQSSLSGSLQVEETLTVSYQQVAWTWQGTDSRGRQVSRSGSGLYGSTAQAPVAHTSGGAPAWLWVVLGAVVLGALALGTARWRRLWPFL